MHQLFDTANSLLGIYLRDRVLKKMHSRVFVETLLFTKSSNYKQCNINYSGAVSWFFFFCLTGFVCFDFFFFCLLFYALSEKVWGRKNMKLGGPGGGSIWKE